MYSDYTKDINSKFELALIKSPYLIIKIVSRGQALNCKPMCKKVIWSRVIRISLQFTRILCDHLCECGNVSICQYNIIYMKRWCGRRPGVVWYEDIKPRNKDRSVRVVWMCGKTTGMWESRWSLQRSWDGWLPSGHAGRCPTGCCADTQNHLMLRWGGFHAVFKKKRRNVKVVLNRGGGKDKGKQRVDAHLAAH